MTVPAIAAWAQRKGLDLIGTGDCLQPDWLHEIETSTEEAEPGFRKLRPEVADRIARELAPPLRRALRYLLSTEVCCAPTGTPPLGGLHHLIYFPFLESVRRFQARVRDAGDLGEGRPTLNLDSRRLLELVIQQDDGTQLAPAHIFNPWYSSLGTVSGGRSLEEIFGDLTPHLLAAEMGLTSIPSMCRRVSALDQHGLFCCSDAHSLPNIGREYTLLEIEPNQMALSAALRDGTAKHVRGLVKFPVERARYFPNWCGLCRQSSFDQRCPQCHRPLVAGSRDRLEAIADRDTPLTFDSAPPVQQLFPLAYLLAELMQVDRKSRSVERMHARLLATLGDERRILTEISEDEIAGASTRELARRIVGQRTSPARYQPQAAKSPRSDQLSLGF